MTHALNIDTLYTLLAAIAFATSACLFIAVCVAVECALWCDASMADASAECDAECDARFYGFLVSTMLAADTARPSASEVFAVRGPILRIVAVGVPASVPAAESSARPSGIYPATHAESHAESSGRPTPNAGYRVRPPVLNFDAGTAYVFLAGRRVRTPRGRWVPATLALSQRGTFGGRRVRAA